MDTSAFAIKYGFPGVRLITVGLTVILVSAAAGCIPSEYAIVPMGKIAQVKRELPEAYTFYLLAFCMVLVMEPKLWIKNIYANLSYRRMQFYCLLLMVMSFIGSILGVVSMPVFWVFYVYFASFSYGSNKSLKDAP